MSTLLEYKCPCCGGGINFDSASQQMKCPFCGSVFDVETLKSYDEDLKGDGNEELDWDKYDKDSGNGDWQEGEQDAMSTYGCQSCGAQIVADETTAATNCPYCGNPIVMKNRFTGMLRPDYVIPFKLDKEVAKNALKEFIKKKPLLPKFFATENHIEEIKGVYVPFWLFDCDTDAKMRYRATNIATWSDSKYSYTKTDTYSLVREGSMVFEKVPVDGSSQMDDAYMEAIEPFDYSQIVDFQTAYLSGFLTNKYDVDSETSIARANVRIQNSVISCFQDTVQGYCSCVPINTTVNLKKGTIHYALLPVWMLNTKYKNKIYTFAMNGQTGKFVGELPVDKGRYWRYLLSIFAGLTILGTIITLL